MINKTCKLFTGVSIDHMGKPEERFYDNMMIEKKNYIRPW